jgi:hypothetical protein
MGACGLELRPRRSTISSDLSWFQEWGIALAVPEPTTSIRSLSWWIGWNMVAPQTESSRRSCRTNHRAIAQVSNAHCVPILRSKHTSGPEISTTPRAILAPPRKRRAGSKPLYQGGDGPKSENPSREPHTHTPALAAGTDCTDSSLRYQINAPNAKTNVFGLLTRERN